MWSFGLSIMTCALGRFPYSSKGGYWELLHMIRNEPVRIKQPRLLIYGSPFDLLLTSLC